MQDVHIITKKILQIKVYEENNINQIINYSTTIFIYKCDCTFHSIRGEPILKLDSVVKICPLIMI